MPAGQPVALNGYCADDYPDWTVGLTFADGTSLELKTYESNYLSIGGPWQTTIDNQIYVQYSADFVVALHDILDSLSLSTDSPTAIFCTSWRTRLLDMAFPPA